jgi:hypothetical protein
LADAVVVTDADAVEGTVAVGRDAAAVSLEREAAERDAAV